MNHYFSNKTKLSRIQSDPRMNQNGFSRESNKKSYTSEKADHADTKKPDIPSQRHLALNKKFLLSPPTNKAYCHSTVIALSLLEEARKLIESVGYCPKASLSRFIELSNPN